MITLYLVFCAIGPVTDCRDERYAKQFASFHECALEGMKHRGEIADDGYRMEDFTCTTQG